MEDDEEETSGDDESGTVLKEMFDLLSTDVNGGVRVRQLARNYATAIDLNRCDAHGRLVIILQKKKNVFYSCFFKKKNSCYV